MTEALCFGRRIDLETEDLSELIPRELSRAAHCVDVIPHQVGIVDDDSLLQKNILIDSNVQGYVHARGILVIYMSSYD